MCQENTVFMFQYRGHILYTFFNPSLFLFLCLCLFLCLWLSLFVGVFLHIFSLTDAHSPRVHRLPLNQCLFARGSVTLVCTLHIYFTFWQCDQSDHYSKYTPTSNPKNMQTITDAISYIFDMLQGIRLEFVLFSVCSELWLKFQL